MKQKRPRDLVLERLFSQRNFQARLAEHLGVSIQAVNGWSRIPIERVHQVSQFTGLELAELRPDVFNASDGAATCQGHIAA